MVFLDSDGLVAVVVSACIVTSRRVPIVSRRGDVAVRRITVTVAVCRITVTVAVRWIAIAVSPRRQGAAYYACGDPGTDPATQTSRLCRLRGSKGCCGNTGSRDNGCDRLAQASFKTLLINWHSRPLSSRHAQVWFPLLCVY